MELMFSVRFVCLSLESRKIDFHDFMEGCGIGQVKSPFNFEADLNQGVNLQIIFLLLFPLQDGLKICAVRVPL